MSYFESLIHHYKTQPDERGWVHTTCPHCGKSPAENYGQTHFSFGEKGGHCFVCGFSCSLSDLMQLTEAEILKEEDGAIVSQRQTVKKKTWFDIERNTDSIYDYVTTASKNRNAYNLWRLYKAINEDIFSFHKLGYGTFPPASSLCHHSRLLCPMIAEGKVIGLRGRRVSCDCPKWLAISGSEYVLYNGGMLLDDYKRGSLESRLGISMIRYDRSKPLFIVENAVDSLLLQQRGFYAVATLGVTNWLDSWTKVLYDNNPGEVIIVYDNDGAGCPNKETYQVIKEKNDAEGLPTRVPSGYRLRDRLQEYGINARIFRWAKGSRLKKDIGELLK